MPPLLLWFIAALFSRPYLKISRFGNFYSAQTVRACKLAECHPLLVGQWDSAYIRLLWILLQESTAVGVGVGAVLQQAKLCY